MATGLALLVVPVLTWAQTSTTSAPASTSEPASVSSSAAATTVIPVPLVSETQPTHSYFAGMAIDPTGGTVGSSIAPAPGGDDMTAMTVGTLYDKVVHNAVSINMIWVLITGFLVMFMQLGFAMVETGLCRAKNAGHTFAMNMMIYPLGCFAFWAYGFAVGWGNWFNGPAAPGWFPTLGHGLACLNEGVGIGAQGDGTFTYGLMGTKGFFLGPAVGDTGVMALFFFMMVFMDTTATIPTGTMAERWKWNHFCIYGLWIAFPYCLYANWVWGGGWLAQMGKNWGLGNGAIDFAGSGVVHCMGGVIALVGGIMMGPRIGKYIGGKAQAIPGHDLPMVMGGTFVLCFGWFGFNPGSTLAGTDLRISFIVVNTMLAGICGALSSMVVMQLKFGKPDPSMMCNGMLAGLVAITAPCAFVGPLGAVFIGTIAGVVVVYSVFFWDKMGVDDPVGAISVHGVNGFFGVIAVGLFANGDYGAGFGGITTTVKGIMPFGSVSGLGFFSHEGFVQLGAQFIDGAVCIITGGVISFVLFKLTNLITPMRVSREVELEGLDIPETGALAYPDFELKTTPSATSMEATKV